MIKIHGGCGQLNELIKSAYDNHMKEGMFEPRAADDAVTVAAALGWMKSDGSWRTEAEFEGFVQKAVDVTPTLIRVRVRQPIEFKLGSFRVIDIDKGKGIRAVIGRLKGETKTTVQSFLFLREKGWTPETAEKWVRDHGETPV